MYFPLIISDFKKLNMIIDIIAGSLLAFGLYQGYSRGLIKTVFETISIIVAVVAALKLSPLVIHLLQSNINFNPAILFVLGFVLTFILIMIAIRFVGNQLEKLFKSLNINFINKVAGAALMGLFYMILLSFAIYFMDKISLVSEQQKFQSFSYPILKLLPSIAQDLGEALKPLFSEFWDALMDTMDEIKQRADSSTGG